MSTYLLITPTNDELYHYGVKGMKWHHRKAQYGMEEAMTSGAAGAELDEIEAAEREAQEQLAKQEAYNRYFESKKDLSPTQKAFYKAVGKRNSKSLAAKIKAGRRKMEQIRKMAEAVKAEISHSDEDVLVSVMDMTPDDLAHHGILGQKWGIRRFQPYQPGAKVKGGKEVGIATKVKQRVTGAVDGIKERRAAKKKAAQVKKAQATRKANADYEAAKKKAIESGSAEDLAKFKGKLTAEEYSSAFRRLENEKKLDQLVAASQPDPWEKIDKGFEIVKRVGGYANTIATAKESFDKLSKDKKDAAKEKAEAKKNEALTNVTNLTELNKVQKEHNLNADDYAKGLKIITTKEAGKKSWGDSFVDKDRAEREAYDAKQKAKYDETKAKMDAEKAHRQAQKEAKKAYKKDLNTPMDGEWRKAGEPKTNQLLLEMKDSAPSKSAVDNGKRAVDDYATRMANVRKTYAMNDNKSYRGGIRGMKWETRDTKKQLSEYEQRMKNVRQSYNVNRSISGAKTGKSGSYRKPGVLNFGDEAVKYKRSGYHESKKVKDTRSAVAATKKEAERQRELDKRLRR